jgi:intein/homing endonuclease
VLLIAFKNLHWTFCKISDFLSSINNSTGTTGQAAARFINNIFLLFDEMALLKPELKEEIIKQIKKGNSINKISKDLSAGKSTIYYYYKKIKGKKYKEPHFTLRASETEGEIVGIFAGDGSQFYASKQGAYQINIHFGAKNEKYAKYVKKIFENYFNKKFWLAYEKEGSIIRVRTQSKKIFYYFKEYLTYGSRTKHSTVRLNTLNLPKEFKKGFLRGLFDTDGSVLYQKKEKRVRIAFYTTSSELMKQIKLLMKEFDFKCGYGIRKNRHKRYKDLYVLWMWKESNDKFLKEIAPFKKKLLKGR